MEKYKYLEWLYTLDINAVNLLSNFWLDSRNSTLFSSLAVFQEEQKIRLPILIEHKLNIYEQEY